jgi:hypothetical protein
LAELADLSFEVRTDVVPRLIFHRRMTQNTPKHYATAHCEQRATATGSYWRSLRGLA